MQLDVNIEGDTYIVDDGFNKFNVSYINEDKDIADKAASYMLAITLYKYYNREVEFTQTMELLRKKFKEFRRKKEIDGDFK